MESFSKPGNDTDLPKQKNSRSQRQKLTRCPKCGRRIQLPCLACHLESIRFWINLEDDGSWEELYGIQIPLELREAEQIRYEQVRNYREKYGIPMFS